MLAKGGRLYRRGVGGLGSSSHVVMESGGESPEYPRIIQGISSDNPGSWLFLGLISDLRCGVCFRNVTGTEGAGVPVWRRVYCSADSG